MKDGNEVKVLRGDRCRCSGCGCYFNSTAAFDKHRIGFEGSGKDKIKVNRRCLNETEMLDRGMALNSSGFWVGSLRTAEIVHSPLSPTGSEQKAAE